MDEFVEIKLKQMDEFLKSSAGWFRSRSGNEWIYDFHMKKIPVIIKVASSIRIDTERSRNKGSDAIRVYAVVKKGLDPKDKIIRGLLKASRVYRTKNWKTNLKKLIISKLDQAYKIYHKNQRKIRR
ncbi:hypothetical protein LCGC14_0579780 [marine sediment metagenome]|uniref:Uncharacterized protein n=1 Tax=marine sediment metagenome TaxID=412755 RepID=A0A0F9U2X1_9ZZZZ